MTKEMWIRYVVGCFLVGLGAASFGWMATWMAFGFVLLISIITDQLKTIIDRTEDHEQ